MFLAILEFLMSFDRNRLDFCKFWMANDVSQWGLTMEYVFWRCLTQKNLNQLLWNTLLSVYLRLSPFLSQSPALFLARSLSFNSLYISLISSLTLSIFISMCVCYQWEWVWRVCVKNDEVSMRVWFLICDGKSICCVVCWLCVSLPFLLLCADYEKGQKSKIDEWSVRYMYILFLLFLLWALLFFYF